ncbi:MAG: TatD family hydrolase [Gammaproteobacteria bacterium]|nr:TatD family hydrolase [Gammaproteobacteria bacterium]
MELIDTHCHLDLPVFDPDRERILTNCRRIGVNNIVIPGISASGWKGLLDLCAKEDGLYPALGLHPLYLDRHHETDIVRLEEVIGGGMPVAVGEIGLDYYARDGDRSGQQKLFESQLSIARHADLPVLLHVRKAHDRVLATLRRIGVTGGIAHAFNGSLHQGMQYLELGFKLGFGGMLTYKRSRRLRALARDLPLGALVLETDAPDLAVVSHHGERNSPEYLPECLAAMSEVRDDDPGVIAMQTTQNVREVLSIL